MGRTYIRTLDDARRHGLVLHVRCGMCQRETYLLPDRLIRAIPTGSRRRIWPHTTLDEVTQALRCRGGAGVIGCGSKDATVRAMWRHELPPHPLGVSSVDFLNADDRERRRLIRNARG